MDATQTIRETNFHFPGQKGLYRGKVRDVYNIDDNFLVIVATDRVSAFDIILKKPIPFKGQILNQIAAKNLEATAKVVSNWVLSVPDPNVTIGLKCEPFKIEMVVRGYLSGHAWREYRNGKRELCGAKLPNGLNENDKFPESIITPSTKAAIGHDEDISPDEIVRTGIVSKEDYATLEDYSLKLYKKGVELAAKRGLVLVDTKYEFGKKNGQIYLIDEIHTPDSSRYWIAEGYAELQATNQPQRQLSKEFLREWLIDNNFQGLTGQVMPEVPNEIIKQVSERYIELFEQLTGEKFIKPAIIDNYIQRIENNVVRALKELRG